MAYFKEIAECSLLSAEEEKVLGRAMRNGSEEERMRARASLIGANYGLVTSVAGEYARSWHGCSNPPPIRDLIQEGMLGLLRAVGRFDHRKGCRFSTCAVPWIKHYIRMAVWHSQVVRGPHKMTVARRMASGLDCEVVAVQPLDSGKCWDYGEKTSKFPGKLLHPVEKMVSDSLFSRRVQTMLSALDRRERIVIKCLFGLFGKAKTHGEIGTMLGVSQQRIHQIKERALDKLRDTFEETLREMWEASE